MMKTVKICVIGNSHLSSLKLGFDNIASEFPDVKITFFGSIGATFDELVLENRKLIAKTDEVKNVMALTSGGLTHIDVDDYDLFILHGLAFSFYGFVSRGLNQLVTCNQSGQTQLLKWKHLNVQCLSTKLAKKLLKLNKLVLLSPQPFLSERVIRTLYPKWGFWNNLLNDERKDDYALVLYALAAWKKQLIQLKALEQPPSTIAHQFFTQNKFSVNAISLKDMVSKHKGDVLHMNPEYGEIVIRLMIERSKLMLQDISQSLSINDLCPQPVSPIKQNPYVNLPDYCFWRRTVANKSPLEITDWYRKKFDISSLTIASAGSCFAQHIGRQLRQKGFKYLDVEPAPNTLEKDQHLDNGYGMYSARYGNIYTTRQLLQLFDRAFGEFTPKEVYWEKEDGLVDPFRPTIQAKPFSTVKELVESRDIHLEAVRRLFKEAQVFVFTLGLTEAWASIEDGAVYPVAPGVSGGLFNPQNYRFINLTSNEVLSDMRTFIAKAHKINPTMKFILTVSPVPLMATAANQQVIVATTYSKSVLRSVAGQLSDYRKYVDYFPSFEIINSHAMLGQYYGNDRRTVTDEGVEFVMGHFFKEHHTLTPVKDIDNEQDMNDDIVCDEELLAAFGNK